MSSIQRFARLATVLGLFALVYAPRAFADCPLNRIWYGCEDLVAIESAEPTLGYDGAPWQVGQACTQGCYDLPHGALHIRGDGNTASAGCGGTVRTDDLYLVVGLPPGPALSFFVELDVDGVVTGPASIEAGLLENSPGGSLATKLVNVPTPSVQFQLQLPLSYPSGEAFPIEMSLTALGNFPDGHAEAGAALRFGGLPEGATVQSCQNYDVPVPTRPATWGALKAAYR